MSAAAGAAAAVAATASGYTTPGTFGTLSQSETTIAGWGVGSGAGNYLGFQFTAPNTGVLNTVRLALDSAGDAGNIKAMLYTNNAGNPGTQIGADSDTKAASGGTENLTFTFAGRPSLTASTVYWIIFADLGSTNFIVSCIANDGSYGSGRNNTITSITTTGLPSSVDARVEINDLH